MTETTKRQGVEKFWMVSVDGVAPSIRHQTKADAIKESKRLALKQGVRVYVLESIVAFETAPPVLIELETRRTHQGLPIRVSPFTCTAIEIKIFADEWRQVNPDAPWRYNPWTGEYRERSAIAEDPYGYQIVTPAPTKNLLSGQPK